MGARDAALADIEIIECEQGTDEWFIARAKIPTASKFQAVLSPKAGKEGKMRVSYLYRLAGERITGEPSPVSYTDYNMERGKEMEPEARDRYIFSARCEIDRPGFIKHTKFKAGVSPDGLVGDDGGVEIKTAFPHIIIEHLMKQRDIPGYFPSEHRAQVQGSMLITGRQWWDLVIYWPKMPLFTVRAHRDDGYIAQMKGAIVEFNRELDTLVTTLKEL